MAQLSVPAGTGVRAPVEDEALYAARTRLDRIGRILAPVMINGQGPFRFVLDSGANHSVVTARLAEQLHLIRSPDAATLLNGVTGSELVPTANVARLETGDLVQTDLRVPVLENVMGGADGILGMQGFEGMRITVDFLADRVTIARSHNQRAPWNFYTAHGRLKFGRLLVVDARVGGVSAKAVIDTGAERTLANLALRDALLRHEHFGQGKSPTEVMGVTSALQKGDVMPTPPIKLGEAVITDVAVTYGDIYVFKLWELGKEPALLVGMDVLGVLHKLVLDFRRKELQLLTR
jgi:predicted aspartyl protease